MGPSVPLRTGILCLWIAAATLEPLSARAVTVEGDVTYTSDYILRGVSETGGRGAVQLDVRAETADESFAGVFVSTLNRLWLRPTGYYTGWRYELQAYVGHRFDLSPSWSTTVTATSYSYLAGNIPYSDDYQELSATASYLDLWTVEVSWSPNAVRFQGTYRAGRYPSYVASTTAQLPLFGRLALTAGAGYYASDGDGYGFGNVGLAFEIKSLRLDAGYYLTDDRAEYLFPYGRAGSRFAASVSWHF